MPDTDLTRKFQSDTYLMAGNRYQFFQCGKVLIELAVRLIRLKSIGSIEAIRIFCSRYLYPFIQVMLIYEYLAGDERFVHSPESLALTETAPGGSVLFSCSVRVFDLRTPAITPRRSLRRRDSTTSQKI